MHHLPAKAIKLLQTRGLSYTASAAIRYLFISNPLVRPHVYKYRRRRIFQLPNAEERFTEIFNRNYWGVKESVSGAGSTLVYTENLRKELPLLFRKFAVNSVLDAPCGDFNWMKEVLKQYCIEYTGGDIVARLIQINNERNFNKQVRFIHLDITANDFPYSDMMICRDCLFHLSYADTLNALNRFIESGIPYFLTSTHINTDDFQNKNVDTGDWRRIDLFSAPYHFPREVLYRIDDWIEPHPKREMCLWTRDQLIGATQKFGAALATEQSSAPTLAPLSDQSGGL